jgi:hypothetical protein
MWRQEADEHDDSLAVAVTKCLEKSFGQAEYCEKSDRRARC